MKTLSFTTVQSFWVELEKLAASIEALEKGVKRLPIIDNSIVALSGGGGMSLHSKDVRNVQRGSAAYLDGSKPLLRLKKIPLVGNWLHGAVRKRIDKVVRGNQKSGIHLNTAVLERRLKPYAVDGKLSPEGKRALRTVTALHEQYELAVPPKQRHAFSPGKHHSPNVLLKEHNLLSRISGPGTEEASGAYQNFRRDMGEREAVRDLLKKNFGERALQFLEPGEKIPKAMRKAIVRKIRSGRLR